MGAYVAQRLLAALGVLWAMTILIFGIVHLLPGNVAYMILGEYATAEAIATLERRLGLNDPLHVQYWRWFSGMLAGDFGESLVMERPVGPLIVEALGRSAILAAISIVLVALIGIALGVHSAVHKGTLADRVLTLGQYFFIAVPEFFWCILLIILFAAWLGWLPATGYTPVAEGGVLRWATHLILPVFTLVSGLIAHVSRLTRSSMLETLESGYVLADIGILIGGIVVVETVFAYPGLGRMLIFAIEHHDLPLLMAGMMVVTAVYTFANLAADLVYALLNPRIRYGRSAA